MDFKDPKEVTVWLTRAIAYVAYAFLLISEFLLLQGFLLRLFGANPDSDYVQWAYRSLERVMAPFRGMFTPIELDGNSVLDTSILFAMVMYGIALLAVRALLDWLTYRLMRLERKTGWLVCFRWCLQSPTAYRFRLSPPEELPTRAVSLAR